MKKAKVVDGDVWKKAAQQLARAILRFEKNDYQRVHTENTVRFAYRVKRGNI